MIRRESELSGVLRNDDLLSLVILSTGMAGPGALYICGAYVAGTVTGEAGEDILIAGAAPLEPIARELALRANLKLIRLKHREGLFTLVEKERDGRNVTLVPLRAAAIEDHLSRAAFSIDAIALDLAEIRDGRPRLIDPAGGISDLSAGTLRVLSPGAITGDPANVLRAVDVCQRLRLKPDGAAVRAIEASAGALGRLPGARVFRSLARILSGAELVSGVEMLRRFGALNILLPELAANFEVPQNYYHHLGVWEHTIEVLRFLEQFEAEPADAFPSFGERMSSHLDVHLSDGVNRRTLLAVAALLHDIGKVSCLSVETTGRIRFQGHQAEGGRLARGIAARFTLGRRGSTYLSSVIGQHMAFGYLIKDGESTETRLETVRSLGSNCIDVALLSVADRLATRGEASTEEATRRYRRTVSRVLSDYFWSRETFQLVSGEDAVLHAGAAPGPEVSNLLFKARVAQREGLVASRLGALEYMAPDFKGKINGGMKPGIEE